ncbi:MULTISPECIES: CYTH domain-containing protein [Methylomonas]|uniref:CYTH domain protein n=1 Tax=Methylomonas koyamae TaxID=702114 RepID=A0A177P1T1_9GAMM|nr:MULTISPECIES: CYTH domain-containing protein [Methylomonas]OAI24267.1 CYTH domain protein [Methylomonas koyamae]WGS86960.1 CYTH domain-containing protein [Methylomonas sp. UP202]
MALEIEHKFLLANDDWRAEVEHSVSYRQGYLSGSPLSSVRVRVSDTQAWLNIKSATIGTHRHEFEYEIPLADANTLLDELCHKPLVEKTRHFVRRNPHLWEIDEFIGDNHGLIVAEIELSQIGESFEKPAWLGQEVTDDLRYYNNNLSQKPFKDWDK